MALPISQAELFDAEFLDSLHGLRLVATRLPRNGGQRRGERVARSTCSRDTSLRTSGRAIFGRAAG